MNGLEWTRILVITLKALQNPCSTYSMQICSHCICHLHIRAKLQPCRAQQEFTFTTENVSVCFPLSPPSIHQSTNSALSYLFLLVQEVDSSEIPIIKLSVKDFISHIPEEKTKYKTMSSLELTRTYDHYKISKDKQHHSA